MAGDGIAFFQALLVGNRLLLNVFDVLRAAAPLIAIEQCRVGTLQSDLVQRVDQFNCIMDPAIEAEATNGIVHVGTVTGQECTPATKLCCHALMHVVDVAVNDRVGGVA